MYYKKLKLLLSHFNLHVQNVVSL